VARTALWWIRRDLRLADNQALRAALTAAPTVIPLFVLDPNLLNWRYHRHAANRRAFLFHGLRALDASLRERGSRLVVREGDPLEVLPAVVRETGATAVCAEEDYSPYAKARDERLRDRAPLRLLPGLTVHHPDQVRKVNGSPYTIFTPYARTWRTLPLPARRDLAPAPRSLGSVPAALQGVPLPEGRPPQAFPPGEAEARRRLRRFAMGEDAPIYQYGEGRNRLDLDGTSALSPYLRFGMLSAREAVVAATEAASAAPDPAAARDAETWLTELVWREFYLHILHHFPFVLEEAFNPALRRIAWREAPGELEAWKAGRTGFPVVDACMRQLAETGWMHNRGRMIAASFLVKDLLLDWRLGEQHFMDRLVDGDPAANNGGWQWTAGVGTDAAPYFRIFNPVLQGRKFDPEGGFVRRFVPELMRVPDRFIQEPWRMGVVEQRAAGCTIGVDYPAQIVDRAAARGRTLAAYKASQRPHGEAEP
jgi:deoxyribodipyrimidine photo-lyase